MDSHRQQLGLTFGQTDLVRSLHGSAKVKRLVGMLQVGPIPTGARLDQDAGVGCAKLPAEAG